MRRTTLFKQLLLSKNIEYIMEAHNAISGKIVEEAGFKGIWASGLSISAALGFRDNNEASWTQVLDVIERICDNTNIPLIVDADTGYGNFNNARIFARKLEQRGAAAICIEDKLFPKKNSFINGKHQKLADISEFCGKIKAIRDAVHDPDFCIIARTETFIVGNGLEEALTRAEVYKDSGADSVLVHSKLKDASEIKMFMNEWKDKCPIVVVPTTYYQTNEQEFDNMGVSIVIWANHMMRASISNMRRIAEKICSERSIASIEEEIVPVKEVFRLQNIQELELAEKRYVNITGLERL